MFICTADRSAPGPGMYDTHVTTLGRVPDSKKKSAPITVFGTSTRDQISPSKTPGPQVGTWA